LLTAKGERLCPVLKEVKNEALNVKRPALKVPAKSGGLVNALAVEVQFLLGKH